MHTVWAKLAWLTPCEPGSAKQRTKQALREVLRGRCHSNYTDCLTRLQSTNFFTGVAAPVTLPYLSGYHHRFTGVTGLDQFTSTSRGVKKIE